MKEFIKKNKKILIIISSIILITLICLLVFLLTKDKKQEEERKKVSETYTMYVSINPLVKLVFTESYEECINDKGEKYICSYVDDKIVDYALLNDDAKEFYKELDFKNKSYIETLVMLCDTARDNKVGFQKIDIITDYKGASREDIVNGIKEKSKYTMDFEVFLDIEESLKEDEVIETINKDIKLYTVKFDSNGGSQVNQRLAKENETLTDLETPIRKGYKFIEWQLDGKKFDSDSLVTKDITLKAKWEKEKNNDSSQNEENITKTIDIKNPKLKALNLYEDSKIFMDEAFFMRYDKTIHVKVSGPKSLINGIKTSSITLGVDLTGVKVDSYGESGKIIVANPLDDVTYEVTNPKVAYNVYAFKKVESTIDKINLNENILVSEFSVPSSYCGSLYIVKNFEEVYKDYINPTTPQHLNLVLDEEADKIAPNSGQITESKFDELSKNLVADTANGDKIVQALENIKKNTYKNFTKFNYNYNEGSLYYRYDELVVADYKLKKLREEFFKYQPISEVLKNFKIYSTEGPCGDSPGGEILLDENLCKTYNLNCSRW